MRINVIRLFTILTILFAVMFSCSTVENNGEKDADNLKNNITLGKEESSGDFLFFEDFEKGKNYFEGNTNSEGENHYFSFLNPGIHLVLPSGEADPYTPVNLYMHARIRQKKIDSSNPVMINFRTDWNQNKRLVLVLIPNGISLLKSSNSSGSLDSVVDQYTDYDLSTWNDIKIWALGSTISVFLNGDEVLFYTDKSDAIGGSVEFENHSNYDIDDIELRTFPDNPDLFTVEKKEGTPPVVSVSFLEELVEEFSSPILSEIWESAPSAQINNGFLSFIPGEKSMETISTRISGPENFTLSTEILIHEDNGPRPEVLLGFGKKGEGNGYVFSVNQDFAAVSIFNNGQGLTLQKRGDIKSFFQERPAQKLTVSVYNHTGYFSLNGNLIFKIPNLPDTQGRVLVGAGEGISKISIDSLTLRTLKEEPIDASGEVKGNVSVFGEDGAFKKPEDPEIDSFNSIGMWNSDLNPESKGSLTLIKDDSPQRNSFVEFDFDMHPNRQGGVHANFSRQILADWSEWGGIEFYARAEGINKAHLTLIEVQGDSFPDRGDCYFGVTSKWQKYRLEFSPENFLPSEYHIDSGSDGRIDYSHIMSLMFEIYGYEGQGKLLIDDLKLLPRGFNKKISNKISIINYDQESISGMFPWKDLYVSPENKGQIVETDIPPGALGTAGCLRIDFAKGEDGYIDYRMDGFADCSDYDGISFYIKGDGVSRYIFEIAENEPDSFRLAPVNERFATEVPVNHQWTEWKLPFRTGVFTVTSESRLANGILDAKRVRTVSFLFPYSEQNMEGSIYIDEISLYRNRNGKDDKITLALFDPENAGSPENENFKSLISEVFSLNFSSISGWRVINNLFAGSEQEYFFEAEKNGADYFIRTSFDEKTDKLYLDLEVFNTVTGKSVKKVSTVLPLGLEIFDSIDEESLDIINTISESNVRYEKSVQDTKAGKVFSDSLNVDNGYWLHYSDNRENAGGWQIGNTLTGISEGGENLILLDNYFTNVRNISFSFKLEKGNFSCYWNVLSFSSMEGVRLTKDGTVVVLSNSIRTNFFNKPYIKGGEQWNTFSLTGEGPEKKIILNGIEFPFDAGMETGIGRIGFAIENGKMEMKDLTVSYGTNFIEIETQ